MQFVGFCCSINGEKKGSDRKYPNYPGLFKWKEPPYEFEYRRPPIDMICGTADIRESIETNRPYHEIEPGIEAGIQNYIETIGNYLLY